MPVRRPHQGEPPEPQRGAGDENEGVHAGHGDLHSLRPADVEELTRADGAAFDTTALSLLLGHHHNTVAVARVQLSDGSDPEARRLAEEITRTRADEVQRMLTLMP